MCVILQIRGNEAELRQRPAAQIRGKLGKRDDLCLFRHAVLYIAVVNERVMKRDIIAGAAAKESDRWQILLIRLPGDASRCEVSHDIIVRDGLRTVIVDDSIGAPAGQPEIIRQRRMTIGIIAGC